MYAAPRDKRPIFGTSVLTKRPGTGPTISCFRRRSRHPRIQFRMAAALSDRTITILRNQHARTNHFLTSTIFLQFNWISFWIKFHLKHFLFSNWPGAILKLMLTLMYAIASTQQVAANRQYTHLFNYFIYAKRISFFVVTHLLTVYDIAGNPAPPKHCYISFKRCDSASRACFIGAIGLPKFEDHVLPTFYDVSVAFDRRII